IVQKDDVILAGCGFALVTVEQDIFRALGLLGDKRPLHAGREAGTAASAQTGGLHLGDDPVRALCNRRLYGLVAVESDVFVDVRSTLSKAARDDFDFIGMGDESRHDYTVSFPRPAL